MLLCSSSSCETFRVANAVMECTVGRQENQVLFRHSTVELYLIATEMLSFASKLSRNKNDSDLTIAIL